MKNETASLVVWGIDRFRQEASFVTEGVDTYVESPTNGGRKSPRLVIQNTVFFKKSKDFFGVAKYVIPKIKALRRSR